MPKRQAPVDLNSVECGYTFFYTFCIPMTVGCRYLLKRTSIHAPPCHPTLDPSVFLARSSGHPQFISFDTIFITESHDVLGPGWLPGSHVQGSLYFGSGSRCSCEHCRELRLHVHLECSRLSFKFGEVMDTSGWDKRKDTDILYIYIIYTIYFPPIVRLRSYLRPIVYGPDRFTRASTDVFNTSAVFQRWKAPFLHRASKRARTAPAKPSPACMLVARERAFASD